MKRTAKSKPWRVSQPDNPSKYGDLQSPVMDDWESPTKGEVELVGSLVTLRGKTAERAKKICQNTGVPLNVLLNESMRVFVELPVGKNKKREINWRQCTTELFKRLDKWKQERAAKPVWNPIPETLTDGWLFGSYTRYAEPKGCCDGDGFVIAPDGQRAELDWHVGTGKLKRTGPADKRIWGVFEIGFPRPVKSTADLVENFRAVLPQIKAAFARHQKRHG